MSDDTDTRYDVIAVVATILLVLALGAYVALFVL